MKINVLHWNSTCYLVLCHLVDKDLHNDLTKMSYMGKIIPVLCSTLMCCNYFEI